MATIKLQVEIDEGLWRKFRSAIVREGLTSKQIIPELIQAYVDTKYPVRADEVDTKYPMGSEDRNRKD